MMRKTLLFTTLLVALASAPSTTNAQTTDISDRVVGEYVGTLTARSKTVAGEPIYNELLNVDFDDFGTGGLIGWGGSSSRTADEGMYKLVNPSAGDFNYSAQFAYDREYKEGYTYTVKFRIRADDGPGTMDVALQDAANGYAPRGNFPSIEFGNEWKEYVGECVVTGGNADRLTWSFGLYVGTIWIDDLVIIGPTDESVAQESTFVYTTEGDIYKTDFSDGRHFGGWGGGEGEEAVKREVVDGVLQWTNPVQKNPWEVQSAIDQPYVEGGTYTLRFRAKADLTLQDGQEAGRLTMGFQDTNGYQGRGSFPDCTLTPEWTDYEATCVVTGGTANRFLFSYGDQVGTIYIDDFQLSGPVGSETADISVMIEKADADVVHFKFTDLTLGSGNGSLPLGNITLEDVELFQQENSKTLHIDAEGFADMDGYTMSYTLVGRFELGCLNFDLDLYDRDIATHYLLNFYMELPYTWSDNLIKNGDMEEADRSCFWQKEPSSEPDEGGNFLPYNSYFVPGAGNEGSAGIEVRSGADPAQAWDTQFWIRSTYALPAGTHYILEFDYKASENARATTQAHAEPSSYNHYVGIGDVNFTTEWQTFYYEGIVSADQGKNGGMLSIAFNLAEVKTPVTYYFDNVKLMIRSNELENLTPAPEREIVERMDPVGINGAKDDAALTTPRKIVENGKVYILNNGHKFTVTGIQLK